jgi:hypothetical protein
MKPQFGRHLASRQAARGDPINRLTLERFREHPAMTTLHPTLLSRPKRLAWVSTKAGEDQRGLRRARRSACMSL